MGPAPASTITREMLAHDIVAGTAKQIDTALERLAAADVCCRFVLDLRR